MKIIVEPTAELISQKAALRVADYIRENPGKLLCFSAGNTPKTMLRELVEMQYKAEIDLNRMYFAALDEWVGVGADTSGSCAQIMLDNFYGPAGIDPARCLLWDGTTEDMDAECARMERWIKDRGGIGLAVLGVGPDGRIGFNMPGGTADARCHVAELNLETREAGRGYFEGVTAPVKGFTIGMKRLLAAERVHLLALGAEKAQSMRRALMGEPDPQCPASLLQTHENYRVFVDRALFTALAVEETPRFQANENYRVFIDRDLFTTL